MTSFRLPGEVLVDCSVALSQAFEGMATAATALKHEDIDSACTALQYMHARLSVIDAALRAIVTETEVAHGSARHH